MFVIFNRVPRVSSQHNSGWMSYQMLLSITNSKIKMMNLFWVFWGTFLQLIFVIFLFLLQQYLKM